MHIPSSHPGQLADLEFANARVVADARILFAAVALSIVPLEPMSNEGLEALILIVFYLVYAVVRRRRVYASPRRVPPGVAHWADVVCYSTLIAMTGALASRYLMFLLFPMVVVSFHYGMRHGMHFALGSLFVFIGIGAVQAGFSPVAGVPAGSAGPLMLTLLVGLMIARWAQSEVIVMRRLAFSNDLNRFCGPHSKLEGAVHSLAAMLRAHPGADHCLVIIDGRAFPGSRLYIADGEDAKAVVSGPANASLADALLSLPADKAVLYRRGSLPWQRAMCLAYDMVTLKPEAADSSPVQEVANLLETDCFISVPVKSRNQSMGRCYVTFSTMRYAREDIDFLAQVLGQAGVMIENMQLAERLSVEVVKEERKKISRDLHDGTIQPYVGLKLGLEALRRRLPGGEGVSNEVDELIEMAGEGITQLRRYVGNLKTPPNPDSANYLLAAVKLQAAKFTDYYGIEASVLAEGDIAVEKPLHDEVIFIVREAFSNIRRHTAATHATARLEARNGWLVLQFANDHGPKGCAPAPFSPRSMSERASALGGDVTVATTTHETTVSVRIPL